MQIDIRLAFHFLTDPVRMLLPGRGACPRGLGSGFPLFAELLRHAPDPRFADIQFDGNFVSGRSGRAGRQHIPPHLWRIRLHKIANLVAKPRELQHSTQSPQKAPGFGAEHSNKDLRPVTRWKTKGN